MRSRIKTIGSLVALLLASFASNAFAESDDNYPSAKSVDFYGDVRMLSASSPAWVGGSPNEAIATSTDVDYIILACGKGKVVQASISLGSTTGDLDMEVYGYEGTKLGGSYGTGKFEAVDPTAAQRSVVVMKVYGYNGATGKYQPGLSCSN